MLGEDEDWLHELSINMFPEDGCLHVYGVGDDGVTAFTEYGIECLQADHRRPKSRWKRTVAGQNQPSRRPAVLTGCSHGTTVQPYLQRRGCRTLRQAPWRLAKAQTAPVCRPARS